MPVAEKIGLLVIDEAHCISDWGHDFRPDYQRITGILPRLPTNVSILCTTATANDRVVADIRGQFGDALQFQRGPLARHSLRLQTIALPDIAAKMAWLKKHLPKLKETGSGIVYVLRVRDAHRVAEWLTQECGMKAKPYTGGSDDNDREEKGKERAQLEDDLQQNRVDVLVATSALGMGFDKPDLAFVVHFQMPGSVVHYYQQVGRAGRALDQANGILLSSPEDSEVTDYFIENALPPSSAMQTILDSLNPPGTVRSPQQLEAYVNLPRPRITQGLKLLALGSPPPLKSVKGGWSSTGEAFPMENYCAKEKALLELRKQEQAHMESYLQSADCLMEFLTKELNDPCSDTCGRCASCGKEPLVPVDYEATDTERARSFIRKFTADLVIEPRKQWPPHNPCRIYDWMSGRFAKECGAQEGRALCVWNDPGWGRLVVDGYQKGRYDPALIEPLTDLIRD